MPEKSPSGRPSGHPPAAPLAPHREPAQRSRVTNGKALHLEPVDGNTAEARRHRDLYEAFLSALPGPQAPTEPVLILVRQAAALALDLERMSAAAPNGLPLDPEYVKAGGRLSRIMRSLGLEPSSLSDDEGAEFVENDEPEADDDE